MMSSNAYLRKDASIVQRRVKDVSAAGCEHLNVFMKWQRDIKRWKCVMCGKVFTPEETEQYIIERSRRLK